MGEGVVPFIHSVCMCSKFYIRQMNWRFTGEKNLSKSPKSYCKHTKDSRCPVIARMKVIASIKKVMAAMLNAPCLKFICMHGIFFWGGRRPQITQIEGHCVKN